MFFHKKKMFLHLTWVRIVVEDSLGRVLLLELLRFADMDCGVFLIFLWCVTCFRDFKVGRSCRRFEFLHECVCT